jgi:hypothetical protein
MKVVRLLAVGLLAAGATLCAAYAQQPVQDGSVRRGLQPRPEPLHLGAVNPFEFGGQFFGGQSKAAQLARKYAKAEKEDEKREIRKQLTDTLSQEFDRHLEQQQKELESLEKQIADLRALLRKRRDAKPTIIDRRIDQLVNDAEGLGWNAPGTPHGLFGGQMVPQHIDPSLPRPTKP